MLKLVGFPGGKRLEVQYGSLDRPPMVVNATVREGYSGGGVFSQSGDLVGIIYGGTGSNETHATDVVVLTSFVRTHLGAMPKCHSPQPPRKSPKSKPPAEEMPPAPPVEDAPPAPVSSSVVEDELKRLEKRIDELRRDLANLRLKKGDTGPKGDRGIPGPSRTVTVIFQDESGRQLTTPVVVPPDKSIIRVPIERIVLD